MARLLRPHDWPLDRRYRLRVEFTGRCDADNVVKACADALQTVLYDNDRQVDEMSAARVHGGDARTQITVEVLDV